MNADFEGALRGHDRPPSPRACGSASRPASPASRSRTYTDDRANPLYRFDLAVARVRAARARDRQGGRRRACWSAAPKG